MLRKNRSVLFLFLLLALPALAAQTGTVARSAELRSTPFPDGKVLKTLPVGASVEVLKRNGGWYQVRSAGQDGWVRMWLLRFSGPATGGSAKDTVAAIQSGRSSATYTTATTGVRGLSEEDLAKAQPDPAAVQALEKLAVTQADAQGFAQKASLRADPEALKQ